MAKKPENDWMSGPYTGPVFRKFEGLDKVPQTSVGFLTRLSRKMTDYGMGMMNFSGARHFNLSRKFFLDNGDTGYIHTIINRGVDGAPMVLSRVTLDARYEAVALPPLVLPKNPIPIKDPEWLVEETEPVPLFYFLSKNTKKQYRLDYYEGNWKLRTYECELPLVSGWTSFWCGEKASDFVLYHSGQNSFYTKGGKLLVPMDPELGDAWLGGGMVKAGNYIVGCDGNGVVSALDLADPTELDVLAEDDNAALFNFNITGDTGIAIWGNEIIRISIEADEDSVSASFTRESAEYPDINNEDEFSSNTPSTWSEFQETKAITPYNGAACEGEEIVPKQFSTHLFKQSC